MLTRPNCRKCRGFLVFIWEDFAGDSPGGFSGTLSIQKKHLKVGKLGTKLCDEMRRLIRREIHENMLLPINGPASLPFFSERLLLRLALRAPDLHFGTALGPSCLRHAQQQFVNASCPEHNEPSLFSADMHKDPSTARMTNTQKKGSHIAGGSTNLPPPMTV